MPDASVLVPAVEVSAEETKVEAPVEGKKVEPEKVETEVEEKIEEEEVTEEEETGEKPKIVPVHPKPTYAELKAEYPELFKKFPGLRETFFREKEYSNLFPTVDDAREAQEDSEALSSLRENVLGGNLGNFFDAIVAEDPKAMSRVAKGFLPALYEASHDAYFDAVNPVLESAIQFAYKEGESQGGDEDGPGANIKNAALVISQVLFGTVDVATGKKTTATAIVTKPEDKTRQTEELTKQFMSYSGDVTTSIRSEMAKLAEKNLDPDGVLTPGMKRMLVRDIISGVDSAMGHDKAHSDHMDNIWRKARQSGFREEYKSRLISTYLERAKPLLPSIRRRLLEDALGTSTKAGEKAKEKAQANAARKEIQPSAGISSTSSGRIDPKKVDWSKTSDLDFIQGNVTLRK